MFGVRGNLIGPMDRSTVGGDIAYREKMARQGPLARLQEASIASVANTTVAADLLKQRRMEERTLRDRHDARAEREEMHAGASSSTDRAKYQQQAMEADKLVKASEERLKALDASISDNKMKVTQIKAELASARIGVMQADLGILRGREQTAISQSRQIGGMSSFDQRTAKYHLDRIADGGTLDSMGPEAYNMARSLHPEFVAKADEKRGNESEVMKQLRGDPRYKDTFRNRLDGPDDIRKQAQQAADKISVQVKIDKIEFAGDVKKAVTEGTATMMIEQMQIAVRREIDGLRREIEAGLKLKNARGGQ